jgi:DNA-directed RNA polymerase I, II, and III subunit RPABC2
MSDYESESVASSDSESSITKTSKPVAKTAQKRFLGDEPDAGSEAESESGSEDGSNAESDSDVGSEDLDEIMSDAEVFGEDEEVAPVEGAPAAKKQAKPTHKKSKKDIADEHVAELDQTYFEDSEYSDDDDEEDAYGEEYLQKFDETIRDAVLENHHRDLLHHNYEEVEALTVVVRDERGIIIDPLHRTMPMLTKYEKARILGERAKQINGGAKPFVPVKEGVIDGYLIALSELEQKKIPFIIRRPVSDGFEYWRLKDLEIIF